MRRSMKLMGAAVVVGAVLVAGCSKSGGGGSSGFERSAGGGGGGAVAPQPATAQYDAKAQDAAGGAAAAKANPLDLTDPKALIRTAQLTVSVKDGAGVAAQADRAAQIARGAGGDVYADNRSGGDKPSASMTLKVPPETLNTVLAQLAALGKEESRQLSTRDVTTEVADIDARVTSARESIARLRLLFGKATRIGDIIAIESELAQRQANLESLEAQQRTLAAQTSMATVNLTLTAAAPVNHESNDDRGFLGGLAAGWRHFADAAVWTATAVGAALPFLVFAALVAGALLWLRRRVHRVLPPPAAPAPAPTPTPTG